MISKIHPTLRRDCNYSNLDRIRVEARYDEDNYRWILPDLVLNKTSLPSAGKSYVLCSHLSIFFTNDLLV